MPPKPAAATPVGEIGPKLLASVRHMHREESTDALLYRELARQTKSEHNRAILLGIAADEAQHRDTWGAYLNEAPRPNMLRVRLFSLLARIFGLVFTINLMEAAEEKAVATYLKLRERLPMADKMIEDETRHEEYLISLLKEERLSYISSMVLGLSDALVELTGALAGFTLALNNNTMIGLAGFITGVAATLSMASSEYLARKADQGEKHPLKAAAYTGMAYLIAVVLLLIPYGICSTPLSALLFCLTNAALIILVFTFFVAVVRKQSFWRGFREMICICFGVACISFLIGWAARTWLNLDL